MQLKLQTVDADISPVIASFLRSQVSDLFAKLVHHHSVVVVVVVPGI